jgi:rhodanese-related sulfurtransferase
MKTLSVHELAEWMDDEKRPQPLLLDVREPWEQQICRIDGSELVPMRTVPAKVNELEPDRPVVCVCHHGHRSMYVAMFLEQHGYADVYNLEGGVDAWARQIDKAMAIY